MRPTLILVSFLLATALSIPGSSSWAVETKKRIEDAVIESFNGSPDLPDEIAFDLFLSLVEGASEGAERFDQWLVADALGIELEDDRSFAAARSRSAFFHNAHVNKKMEQLSSKISVLCSQRQAGKNVDQLFGAMDATDDIQRAVLKKHYLTTFYSLSAEEQKALTAYLDDLKLRSSYVRLDNRKLYDGNEQELRATAEQQCSEYKRDYQILGGAL